MYLFIHTIVISLLPDVIRGLNHSVIHDTVTLQYGIQVSVSQYKRLHNVIQQESMLHYVFNWRETFSLKWTFLKKQL